MRLEAGEISLKTFDGSLEIGNRLFQGVFLSAFPVGSGCLGFGPFLSLSVSLVLLIGLFGLAPMGVVALEGGLDFGEGFAGGAEGFLGFVLSFVGLGALLGERLADGEVFLVAGLLLLISLIVRRARL